MKIGLDVLRKSLHAHKHPGIAEETSFFSLVKQGLPYLTSLSATARPPLTIYWNVNSVCNLHCKMCDVGTFNEESNFYKNLRIDRKLHEISIEKFSSVVDEVARFRPLMAINGTEPMMYKPLGRAIEYARSRELDVAVTTGAYDLPRRAEELAKAGLGRLSVSLDGPPVLHNEIRGRKDVFERATEGIEKFWMAAKQQGYTPEILLLYTITNLNSSAMIEFYEAVKNLPFHRINFVFMNFVTQQMALEHNLKWGKKYPATVTCLSDEVQPSLMDVSAIETQILEVKKRAGDRISILPLFDTNDLHKYFHRTSEFMGNVPCLSTWYFAQVMADGEVIPYTRCYNVPLGNINQHSFMDIWNGPAAKAWRQDLRSNGRFPGCRRCPLVC
ncbi:MAG: radical SAM protein [Betaproteobacteria bacterium]|nr:radical SAM protein [Betaproteobacteria bacterium]